MVPLSSSLRGHRSVVLVALVILVMIHLHWNKRIIGDDDDDELTTETSIKSSSRETETLIIPSIPSKQATSPRTIKKHCDFRNRHWECEDALSQGNQDCILEGIFHIVGTRNQRCVEFGFGYNPRKANLQMEDFQKSTKILTGLNTHRLIQKGFQPTFFDTEFQKTDIGLFKATLTEDNIVQEFEKASVPKDVDYVSIDVDSVDVWLFHGLLQGGYRPRVISVEHNSNFPIDMPLAVSRKWAPWNHAGVYGSSATALNYVAEKFGYRAVAIMTKLDVFFVREDLLQESCSNYEELDTFESISFSLKEDWKDFGIPHHFKKECNVSEAKERLVHVPLVLEGKEEKAKIEAQKSIVELNRRRREAEKPLYCQGFD